jgi:hypothetical protein
MSPELYGVIAGITAMVIFQLGYRMGRSHSR